jgi:serine/threonine protein kinase
MRTLNHGRFILLRKLGSGGFGEIYESEDTRTNEHVAVKIESSRAMSPRVIYESKLYTLLQDCVGVPRLIWFGIEYGQNAMAISLLGKSLDVLASEHTNLSLKTVLMLVPQMICCVEEMHRRDLIHRDLKPGNFLMGLGPHSNQVFVVDFGLSTRFRDKRTREHIPYREGLHPIGTPQFPSAAALAGCEQSRRDDIEALGLVWLFLLKGEIQRGSAPIELLCAGQPPDFAEYLHSVRALGFRDEPDYSGYRKMFTECFMRLGFVFDYEYDWVADARTLVTRPMPKGIEQATRKGKELGGREDGEEEHITPNYLRERLGTPRPPQPKIRSGRIGQGRSAWVSAPAPERRALADLPGARCDVRWNAGVGRFVCL